MSDSWSLDSQSSFADLLDCCIRSLRDAVALAKIAGLTGPPLGESFNTCSLCSLMALSTTAFLLIFFGRPISSLIPRGSRDLSDLKLDKDD